MKPLGGGAAQYAPGEVVFQEGEPGRQMFVIEEGQVEIFRSAAAGPKRVGTLGAGDFFGEMAIIDDLPRAATVRALTECRLLAIDHGTFDRMLRQFPEVAIRMLRKMSARLRELEAAEESREAQPAVRVLTAQRLPAVEPEAPAAPAAGPAGPRLVLFETGATIPLPDQHDIRVGRLDTVTGQRPEIDLSDIDTYKTTSRKHAKIVRENGRFLVVEEIGTANGTFVNGNRLATGTPVEVKEGDWIQFGGVKTILRLG